MTVDAPLIYTVVLLSIGVVLGCRDQGWKTVLVALAVILALGAGAAVWKAHPSHDTGCWYDDNGSYVCEDDFEPDGPIPRGF